MNLAKYMETVALELLGPPDDENRRGSEWRYGTNGSLAINLDIGTFYDFENEEGGGVLDLIKREKGLTGKDAFEWLRSIGCDVAEPSNGKAKRKMVDTFDYRDENGTLVFQVCRYEPKHHNQRKPNGLGGWEWNVKGSPALPYKLPELLKAIAAQRVIFIAEGERKVNALLKWDIAATCNAGGAKSWKPEHSAFLKGANVVILPDNDDAGRNHANVVGESLQGIAANVRLLELPGLEHKSDIVNWIADGGTVDQFWNLVETKSRPWSPYEIETDDDTKDDEPSEDVGISADDFLAYMPEHKFIYRPTGDFWVKESVNSRLAKRGKLPASVWLDRNHHVEQMTWAPGKPELIKDRLFADGAWIPKTGVTVYNRYRPATIKRQPGDARPFIKLGVRLFGAKAFRHIRNWFACREQGIGKDTIIEALRKAVGEWNCKEAVMRKRSFCA
jgi:hypothetical protein